MDDLVEYHVEIAFRCLDPVAAPSTFLKTELFEQVEAFGVAFVDNAVHLVHHEVVEEIVETQLKRCRGVALAPIAVLDEDSYANAAVDGVVVARRC